MPRLSIVIVSCASIEQLETTLVSVLACRPVGAELLAVLNHEYADPYELAPEVRFLAAPRRAGWVECANAGLAVSLAPVVHFLRAGSEVAEGWSSPAVAHFAESRVASVAPLVVDRAAPGRVLATGVGYAGSGLRRVLGAGRDPSTAAADAASIVGPTAAAGFYRTWLLKDVLGGFDARVGDPGADVDLALALRQLGLKSIFEPRSRVLATAADFSCKAGFRAGRGAERLFRRHLAQASWWEALVSHPLTTLGYAWQSRSLGTALATLAGHAAATLEITSYRRYCQDQARWQDEVGRRLAVSTEKDPRRDGRHAPSARGRRRIKPSTARHGA